jgi:hypothetical protein
VFWPSTEAISVYYTRQLSLARWWRRGGWAWRPGAEVHLAATEPQMLGQSLAQAAAGGARAMRRRCDVFLGASESRLAVIEGVRGARRTEDWSALAHQALITDAGLEPEEWQVAFDLLPGAERCLGVAVRRGLIERLLPSLRDALHADVAIFSFPVTYVAQLGVVAPRCKIAALAEPGAVTTFVVGPSKHAAHIARVADAAAALESEATRAALGINLQVETAPKDPAAGLGERRLCILDVAPVPPDAPSPPRRRDFLDRITGLQS